MKGISECLNWMLQNPMRELKNNLGDCIRYTMLGSAFKYKAHGDKHWFNLITFSCFEVNEWNIVPEPIQLMTGERTILENLLKRYKYIARDSNGRLYIYENKPVLNLDRHEWKVLAGSYESFDIFHTGLFLFVKWGNTEPYEISKLLNREE